MERKRGKVKSVPAKPKPKSVRRQPVLEEIEPRILYSADFAPTLLDHSADVAQPEQRVLDAGGEFTQQASQDGQTRRHELVLVESNTPDYQKLIDDIVKQAGDGRSIEVVVLDANKDGIAQISDILSQRQDLSAVHLISHGADGQVQLGSTSLNFDSLLKNAAAIKAWGNAFNADADLLIYGCDVAQHEDGRALVDALAKLTGTDVAASDDLTGAASLGGDWDLEYRFGSVETQVAVSVQEQESYSAVLASMTLSGGTVPEDAANGTSVGTVSVDIASDGSFLGAGTPSNYTTYSSGQTFGGWTVASGKVDLLGSNWDRSPSGGNSVDLGGGVGGSGQPGTISQSVATTNGQQYQVTFELSGQWAGGGTADMHLRVSFGGSSQDITISKPAGWSMTDFKWAQQTLTFTATSASTALSFRSLDTGGEGPIVSDVAVTSVGGGGYTYSLTNSAGGRFAINSTTGAITVANGSLLDYETATSHNVTVRATGGPAAVADTTFTIQVTDTNDAPVLSGANNLTAINEDPTTNNGTLVSALVSGKVTDQDSGAVRGIAVTAVDNTKGTWQYSTNGGSTWIAFGSPSASSARLLAADASTYVRFVPNANWNGTVASGITFRAWDQTSGTAGSTANTTVYGGITAFSAATASAGITVNSVNDAPAGTNKTVTTNEDTSYTFPAADFGFTDPNDSPANTLSAVKISTLPVAGSLTLSGVAVSAGQSISLANLTAGNLKFTPAANANGVGYASFTFQVQDNGGTANGGVDLDPTPNMLTIDVAAVNDAPVASGSATLAAVLEDAPSPSGALVSTLLGGNYSDATDGAQATALSGVAITANAATAGQGTWQYSSDASTWSNVPTGGLSDTTALVLPSNYYLRFVPAANYNGTPGSLTVRLSDGSAGAVTFSASRNISASLGGTGNWSSATLSLGTSVTSVNDAPVGTDKTVSTSEDTAYTFAAADFGFTDPSDSLANALSAVKISTLPGAGGLTNNGLAVVAGQLVSVADIVSGKLKFTPAANASGAGYASFTFQVQDNGGTANGGVDLDPAPRTLTINVTPVNDAPVLSGADDLTAITEDPVGDPGTLVSALIAGQVNEVDAGALGGIAVTAVDNSNGTWQYSTDGGSSWSAFGSPSAASARLLAADATTYVRFVPNANWNGTVTGGISFRAWDQTSGTAGGTADTTVNGGTTAFSTATASASITVNPVNDAPVNTVPTAQATSQNTSLVFSTANANRILISDLDAGGSSVEVTLTATNGTLTLAGTSGLTFGNGNGMGNATMTFTGTVSSINAALDGMSFSPTTGYSGAAAVQIVTDDQGNTGGAALSDTSTVNVTVNAASVPTAANDTFSVNEDSALSVPWWDTNWAARQQITFTGNTFGGAQTLTDFPVLLTLNSGNINYAQTQANGQDLRFFDANGTPLAYQIEQWNPAGDSYVWVKVPQIDTTGTDSIWMYYGNASTSAGQNASAVWSGNGYRAVYHLSDAAAAIADSTANGFGGTAVGGPTSGAGEIGGALSLDGTTQYVDLGNDLPLLNNTSTVTLSAWVKVASTSSVSPIIAVSRNNGGVPTTDSRASIEQDGAEIKLIGRSTNDNTDMRSVTTSTSPLAAGVWHLVTGVIDYASNSMSIFVDGVQQATTSAGAPSFTNPSTPITNSEDAAIGSQDDGSGGYLPGSIDEVRIANVAQSAAWIRAEYLTMTGGFATIGPAQAAPGTGRVLQNDTSASGQPLSAVLVSGPANAASFTFNADGTFVYTPAANFHGTDTFTYRANDGSSDSNTATVTITVNSVNDAPVGTSGTVTTLEDTAYTFAAADFGFTDPSDSPANSLQSVKITTLPGMGGLTNNGVAVVAGQFVSIADIVSGKLKFTPAANASGAGYASFTFQVQDDGGTANGGVDLDATPRTLTIEVTPVNDAPVGTDKTVSTSEDSAYTFAAADFGFTDPSDSPVNSLQAVKITALPGAGGLTNNGAAVVAGQFVSVADIASGKLKFTPAGNVSGAGYASFTFQVQDDGGTANGGVDLDATPRTMTIDVTSVNDAPAGTDKTVTTDEDTAYTFVAADFGFTDPGDSPVNSLQSVKITALPGAGGLTNNGVLVIAGQFVPVADIVSGKLKFTPAGNASGAGYASFTFQVRDDGGTASGGVDLDATPRTMTIDVTPLNDAPVGTDKTVSTSEDSAYTFAAADFGFADPNDSPANSLSAVKISTLPGAGLLTNNGIALSAGQFVTLADIVAGNLKFTPAADANGVGYASFTFQVQDDGGTASGGVDLEATPRTMTIDVTPVNDAPVALDDAGVAGEDTVLSVPAAFGVLANDSDIDGDALVVSEIDGNPASVGSPITLLSGALLTVNADGSYSYDANGQFEYLGVGDTATDGFSYTLSDGNGGSSVANVVITINGANDAPVGSDGTVSTVENTPLALGASDFGFFDVDATDALQSVTIVNLPGAGNLTLSGAAVSAGQVISVVDLNAGNLVFTPGLNENGASYASFDFVVNDGTVDAAAANTLTIDVTNLNSAPAGTDGTVVTAEDTPYAFVAGDFGFSDPNDSPANNLNRVLISTLPGSGTLTLNGTAIGAGTFVTLAQINAGQLVYTPPANANGAGLASFTFQVEDDGGTVGGGVNLDPTSNTIAIDVTPVNDAPVVATNSGLTVNEGAGATITAAQLQVTDVDNSAPQLTYTLSAAPGNGTLYLSGSSLAAGGSFTQDDLDNGRVSYTHNGSETPTDTFTFSVGDGAGGSIGAAGFSVTVNPVNDAPVLGNNTFSVPQGAAVVLSAADLSASDVDNAASTLSFAVSGVTHGQFEAVGTPGVAIVSFTQAQVAAGQIRFVHDGSSSAPSFSVSVSDGNVTVGPFAATTRLVVPVAAPAQTVVVPPEPPASVPSPQPVTPTAPAPSAPTAATALAVPARAPAQPAAVGLPGAGIAAPEVLLNVGPISLDGRRWSTGPLQLQGAPNHMELGGPVQVGLELAPAQAELSFGPLTPPEWTAQFAFPDEGKPHGEQDQIQVLLEQIKLGGMALSVGVVWWASRVSGLLGSLLASAPAWRHIDPLPVVGRDEDEDKDKQWYEGEDLERDADELAVSLVLEGRRERAGAD